LHRINPENQQVTTEFFVIKNVQMKIPNLLLVAGRGTNAGKTTVICRILEQNEDKKIIAVKITPHFHEITPGLRLLEEGEGYAIYEETSREGIKDTNRMIRAGASRVYFAKVRDDKLLFAFNLIMKNTGSDIPVICESPALRNFAEPGVFIIMTSDVINKPHDMSKLEKLPHLLLKYEDLAEMQRIPVGFENRTWAGE